MNEEICCINNKEKTAKNEWENGDSDLQALCNVYKNLDNCFSVLSHHLVERKIHLFC